MKSSNLSSVEEPENTIINSSSLMTPWKPFPPFTESKYGRLVARTHLLGGLVLFVATMHLNAAVIPQTTTTLTVLPSSSISFGTVTAMTATVTDPGVVTSGRVSFCDASRPVCLPGDGLYGTVQITPAGTATLRTRFAAGTNQIVAVFAPTERDRGSKSPSTSVYVGATQILPSVTSLGVNGGPGNYTLSGNVTAFGIQPLIGTISFLGLTANEQIGSASLSDQSFGFGQRIVSPTGVQPSAVVVGDFNGDGLSDVAVANQLDNTVSILLGNNDGSLQPQLIVGTGRWPESIGIGDFNADGILDMAVANTGDNTLSVFLGNGDGTFQTPMTSHIGLAPMSVVVGDFNNDGTADLAIATVVSNYVSILLGNGDGTFQPQMNFATGGDPQSVVATDLNGDGIADLAVANTSDNSVSVLLGNGDGTFQSQTTVSVGAGPYSIAAGDFNGDGVVDLGVCNRYANTVSILIGNGDGTFQLQNTARAGSAPSWIAVADFNADGIFDLVVTNQFDSDLLVLLGNGDGTFHPQSTYGTGLWPLSIAVGDFNGDGIPDLANTSVGSIDVHLGQQVADYEMNGLAVPGRNEVTVFASYPGDSLRQASQSSTVFLASTPATPTVVLTSAPNPASFGTPVTFSAIVTGINSINPTGDVVFKDGSVILGTAMISGATATIATTSLAVGVHSIVTVYSGDGTYVGSSSQPYTQTISRDAATMTLMSSLNPAVYGSNVVFTAVLNPGATGTVTFSDGAIVLGTANIALSGRATISVPLLLAGSHNVTATYSGDSNFF
jgi:hypothetical protein